MPDLYHEGGRLLVRSGWDEDAMWFGYVNGRAQLFREGRRETLRTEDQAAITLGSTRIFFGRAGLKFETGWTPPPAEDERAIAEELAFVIGLDPDSVYDLEVDGEELAEARTDSGGILEVKFATGRKAGVRIRKAAPLVR